MQFVQMSDRYSRSELIVVRDGMEMKVPFKDIVVGDLVFLMSGETIEVDGLLVKGFGVTVMEKDITAVESPINKSIEEGADPLILAGSVVLDGSGLMLVCAVGNHSNIARKRKGISHSPEQLSPLQENVNSLVLVLGKIGLGFAVLLFVILTVYLILDSLIEGTGGFIERFVGQFLLCLTLVIISVPEGLPIAFTVAVFKVANDLKYNNCFIRSSKACEMLGSIDSLIVDKTGVFTMNKMKINHMFIAGVKSMAPYYTGIPVNVKAALAECISRNTNALEDDTTGNFTGSGVECCLLTMIKQWGYVINNFRDPNKHVAQVPLSVQRNKSTTFYIEDGQMKVYSKGHDSLILSRCSHYFTATGEIEELDNELRRKILNDIKDLITDICITTISLSLKFLEIEESFSQDLFIQEINGKDDNMVYIGTAAIKDQINPRAYISVINLLKSSTTITLVTNGGKSVGQYVAESTAIVEKASAYHPYIVMSARFFREKVGYISTAEGPSIECLPLFSDIVKKLSVLYDALPEDKLMLTLGLKEIGSVVAVTGHSINDSHAVKVSDIGIALNSSTTLVKENSDVILLEDSIENVEMLIKYGRHMTQCILKFLKFQIILILVTLIVVTVATISIWDVPLSAIQVLAATIALAGIAAIAISVESPEKSYSYMRPLAKGKLLDKEFFIIAGVQIAYQVVALLAVLWMLPFLSDIEPGWKKGELEDKDMTHYTVFFVVFCFMGLYNMLNARNLYCFQWNIFRKLYKNTFFMVGWVSIFVMIVLIIEKGESIFHCTPAGILMYVAANILGGFTLVVELITKMVLYRNSMKEPDPERKPLKGLV